MVHSKAAEPSFVHPLVVPEGLQIEDPPAWDAWAFPGSCHILAFLQGSLAFEDAFVPDMPWRDCPCGAKAAQTSSQMHIAYVDPPCVDWACHVVEKQRIVV